MHGQPGHNTRPHDRLPPCFLGMGTITGVCVCVCVCVSMCEEREREREREVLKSAINYFPSMYTCDYVSCTLEANCKHGHVLGRSLAP